MIISRELDIMRKHVSATIRLLDDGATVPFIARYRKEATGSLDEVAIRNILQRHLALTEIYKRRDFIMEQIRNAGALTPELQQRILETVDPVVLEDIYLPFKPRRATRAQAAREAGYEPLARMLMAQNVDDPQSAALKFAKSKAGVDAAIAGASDIIAEWVSESEKARNLVRARYARNATITSKVVKGKEEEGKTYANYFDLSEPLRSCQPHRYLAMRRGEAQGFLKISISIDDDEMTERLQRMFVRSTAPAANAEILRAAVRDGYRRLMRPSIESEIAATVKERADSVAIGMFADNVRQLLMAPPLRGKIVMAIDPGFRTGCKVVCLDRQGQLMAHEVIFPHQPDGDPYAAADLVAGMVEHFGVDAIAIGNGTAGRETERFVRDIRFNHPVQIHSVSEAGASIYSASECARAEFPDLDLTVRGAISIGRRLIDPLAELVKIDPQSIGVGQYQHDVNQTKLKDSLDYTVESCVNAVGVDLNTASVELLSYVSGIGRSLARNIVAFRSANGPFKARIDLMKVPRMGEKSFRQCAGFLRIPDADNYLDRTAVHPERYDLLRTIASDMGVELQQLVTDRARLHSIDLDRYATKEAGIPTLTDIITELEKPSRDPRREPEKSVFAPDAPTAIDDLYIGQILRGKVTNVTAFGVFVDIGLKNNGLVHISQITDRFISSPFEVVEIGKFVTVKIIDIDTHRGRVALSMKDVPQS